MIPGQITGHYILSRSQHHHPHHNSSNGSYPHHNTTTTVTSTTPAPDPLHHMVTGWEGTNSILFTALTVAAVIGLVTILFIKPSDPSTGTKPEVETRTVWTQVKVSATPIQKREPATATATVYQHRINVLTLTCEKSLFFALRSVFIFIHFPKRSELESDSNWGLFRLPCSCCLTVHCMRCCAGNDEPGQE